MHEYDLSICHVFKRLQLASDDERILPVWAYCLCKFQGAFALFGVLWKTWKERKQKSSLIFMQFSSCVCLPTLHFFLSLIFIPRPLCTNLVHLFTPFTLCFTMCHLIPFFWSCLSKSLVKCFVFWPQNQLKSPQSQTQKSLSRCKGFGKKGKCFCIFQHILCWAFWLIAQHFQVLLFAIRRRLVYDYYPCINIWSEDESHAFNCF